MTAGLLSLGTEELWETDWSGWAYPARREFLTLLENAVGSTGNVIIQEGSLTRRRGTLKLTAQTRAQRDLIRGYDEAASVVAFTDEDGSVCTVLVNNFGSSWLMGDLWSVDVELIQLTAPV